MPILLAHSRRNRKEWTAAAEKWQKIFQDHESEGLKRKKFCEAKDLKFSTFDHWRARLKKSAAREAAVVKVATVKGPAEPVRIRVNEQIVIEFNRRLARNS